jgi:hypothetical protein
MYLKPRHVVLVCARPAVPPKKRKKKEGKGVKRISV